MFLLMALMIWAWQAVFTGMDEQSFLYWVLAIHIVSWVLQFIGHGVFESTFILFQSENQHYLTISPKFSTLLSSWSCNSLESWGTSRKRCGNGRKLSRKEWSNSEQDENSSDSSAYTSTGLHIITNIKELWLKTLKQSWLSLSRWSALLPLSFLLSAAHPHILKTISRNIS